MAGGAADPLVAVISTSVQVAMLRFEIFQEGMQMGQPGVGRRPVPAGDKQPVSLLRWIEPGGETGMVIRLRLGVQQKAVRVAGDPGIDEIGLAARAFVAESAGMNAVALTDENDTQAVGNGPGVVGGERTPNEIGRA